MVDTKLHILKTSKQWVDHFGDEILDPDGWRTNNIYGDKFEPCDFNTTYIDEYEYSKRKMISTCMFTKDK